MMVLMLFMHTRVHIIFKNLEYVIKIINVLYSVQNLRMFLELHNFKKIKKQELLL